MKLDCQICARARLSRDARFDGKFYIGVRTSGVYCRPICPAPTAMEKNVRYFPTAAAAAEAGFRPCLRCRPECSPGTPAWAGTQSTVSRALRLIGECGLADGGVESLAGKLGVGSRHLRRLFLKHLGATPRAVAQTQRLHFAKKLIDETRLPMIQVAMVSGFGCVRRFNAAIRITYHRSPTQIRALARQTGTRPENHYRFRLNFRPPYNWPIMLRFLEARATPGVESVDQAHQLYRRSISVDGVHGYFEVSPDEGRNALAVRVQFGDPRSLFLIIERIRAMFDLNADWATIVGSLRNDPVLAARVQANPGVRVPGCWDGFELAIRAIVGQQVTVQRATDLTGRIVSAFGPPLLSGGGLTHLFPAPEALADVNFSGIGLTKARSETVRALARAVRDGHISFKGVIDSHSFLAKLCEIPGIGTWTAQYVAMRALGEPDAFPSGDVALLRALDLESATALEAHAEAWRPWRAYAALYLWSIAGEARRDRPRTDSSQARKVMRDKRESHPPTSLAG